VALQQLTCICNNLEVEQSGAALIDKAADVWHIGVEPHQWFAPTMTSVWF